MATPRSWSGLSPTTRKRYLSAGGKQGLTEPQIIQHYESGGSVSAWRGHKPHAGVSERQWSNLLAAARRSKLDTDHPEGMSGQVFVRAVLESLLSKGFTPNWILRRLDEKHDSRTQYHTAVKRAIRRTRTPPADDPGYQPGRNRYHGRNQIADIEIYYYH